MNPARKASVTSFQAMVWSLSNSGRNFEESDACFDRSALLASEPCVNTTIRGAWSGSPSGMYRASRPSWEDDS